MSSPARGVIVLTALAYVPAVLSMMIVGIVVPFIPALGRDLSATPAELGLAIALFSMPTAILATIGGGLIDRYGVRRSMLLASATSALGSVLASSVGSLWAFDCAMLVAGIGFGGVCVTAPCLLIATLQDSNRTRAMSFLSTFAPSGYAAGLLLAVPFIEAGAWRVALQIQAGLLITVVIAMVRLVPRVESTGGASRAVEIRRTATHIVSVIRDPRVLRLALAVALPNAVSYGTSLAAPSYLARVHDLSLAASSATVAFAKIAALIVGSISMGYLLSRAESTRLLFAAMATIGALAQILLFLPASGVTLATTALILWLFAFGGMAGGAMILLPRVAGEPTRTATASGVVNQAISAGSFAVPSIWLTLDGGMQFIALALACLLVSVIALPSAASLPAATANRAPDALG
jgi:predicted MFS family arabinose efflux permease